MSTDPCATDRQPLLSVEDARARILDSVLPITGSEQLFVRQALNRVLAEAVISPLNVPAFDNSAMDGYALNSRDLPPQGETELKIAGRAMAGIPYQGRVRPGEAVRIMTGAPLPEGADTVVMQEHVEVRADRILIGSGQQAGSNIRRAGEDMATGQTVLSPGRRLTPADLGLIASLGLAEVRVKRRLRAAFFSTGDELASLGQPLGDGQIYDSNRYTLHGMLTRLDLDIIDMGVIADDRDAIRQAFAEAMQIADVIFTSGGVSVGEADFIKEILEDMGEVNFWRIRMKPGKPLAYGRLGQAVFFGLPGNPVSVMATFYQFARPALFKLMGADIPLPLLLSLPSAGAIRKSPGRLEYQRGIMSRDTAGEWQVQSTGRQGSHVLTSMSRANCLIILPEACAGVAAGEPVTVQPFQDLI